MSKLSPKMRMMLFSRRKPDITNLSTENLNCKQFNNSSVENLKSKQTSAEISSSNSAEHNGNRKFEMNGHHSLSVDKPNMSLGLSSRLKHPKKHELVKSHSQAQILANKLRQDGVMDTVESVLHAVDQVAVILGANINDPTILYRDSVINLCQHLKVYGAYLEILYKEQLDHAFKIFRDKAQDDDVRVDKLSRLHLLELIELRAKGWKGTEIMNQYYRKKINQFSLQMDCNSLTESVTSNLSDNSMLMSTVSAASPPLLAPGEILKPSGKFTKPTRIPGKKYCKDEIVIRNADSGKVNPGAKERLVQITGANEESINHAKQLIEETIKRNASPVREHGTGLGPLTGSSSSINSSASDDSTLPVSARVSRALMHSLSTNDANIGEYKYTVVTNGGTIKITGDNLDLVRTSKLVLEEYFTGEPIQEHFYSFDSLPQPIVAAVNLNEVPLSPPESLPSPNANTLSNGQSEDSDEKIKIRKPYLTIEEIIKGTTKTSNNTKQLLVYSIEYLAQLAMSPLCLSPPSDWEKILNDYPNLIRNGMEFFDVKQYLSNRNGEPTCVLSADQVLDVTDI